MGKKVVITIHGIRTRGEWQKHLAPILARHDFIPYPLDYGRFTAPAFLIKRQRERKLEWFHNEYDRICAQEPITRPSVIAHSFGTYLTAQLLDQYPEVKFDKVIFAGSIANESFDWVDALEKNRVLFVRNEFATRDVWPEVAKRVIADCGNSGTKSFVCGSHRYLSQQGFKIGHSGTFFLGRFKEWIRYLEQPLLSHSDRRRINGLLQLTVSVAERKLAMSTGSVRANIFVPIDDALVIPDGAHHNMDGHADLLIRIPVGMGSTGRTFTRRLQHIAIFKGHWGDDTLPDTELKKVHSDLRWIISSPLYDPDNGRVFAVMNVDGLRESRTVEELTTGQGEELLSDLNIQAETISKTLLNLEHGSI
ncbi:MAG: alpha/beta hydrolase [Nitrososphaera sp.]|nr:alpha/beta hydrolase [Nitrososphaera sp.]